MVVFKVNIKWKSHKFPAIDIDSNEELDVFRTQVFTLTGIPNESQKIIVKGKILKDNDWTQYINKDNIEVLILGNVPEEKSIHVKTAEVSKDEDMSQPTEILPIEEKQILPNGIPNLGNTCYMNSIFQLLFQIPEIQQHLETFVAKTEKSNSYNLFECFKQVFLALKNSKPSSHHVTQFIENLIKIEPMFGQRNAEGVLAQQDANEFLGKLLETIKAYFYKENVNIIDKLFRIQMVEYLECSEDKNEHSSAITHENYLCCFINQDVKHLLSGLKLRMTEKITKKSTLLEKNAEFIKTTYMNELPPYLLVQMNRFFYKDKEKINAKILKDIKFPMNLDVYDLCSEKLKSEISALRNQSIEDQTNKSNNIHGFYELSSVVTHQGRLSSLGHYIAWNKHESKTKMGNNWIKFDDDIVSIVSEADILKLSGGGDWHCAYILLYSKKNS